MNKGPGSTCSKVLRVLPDAKPARQAGSLRTLDVSLCASRFASELVYTYMKHILQHINMYRAVTGMSVPVLSWVDHGLAWAPRAQRSDRVLVLIL